MKKLTLAVIATLTIGTLLGQESETTNNTKHSISISIGAASPGGEFAETDIEKEESGFAKSGVSLGLDYQYNFHPNLGATFIIRSLGYAYDANALVNEFRDMNPSASYSMESDAYGVGFIGIGIVGEIGSDVVKAYLNPFIGSSSIIYPKQTLSMSQGSNYERLEVEEATATNIMYGFAFGAKFRLSELISLSLNFEYATAPDYELETEVNFSDNQGNSGSMESEYDQPFSTFNTMLKLGFNF